MMLYKLLGGGNQQAMSIGDEGRESTISNIISAAPTFGINKTSAQNLISSMKDALKDWKTDFSHSGVS